MGTLDSIAAMAGALLSGKTALVGKTKSSNSARSIPAGKPHLRDCSPCPGLQALDC